MECWQYLNNKLFIKINYGDVFTKIHHYQALNLGAEICFNDSSLFFNDNSMAKELRERDYLTNVKKISHLAFYDLQLGGIDKYIKELSMSILKKSLETSVILGINKGVMHPALSGYIPSKGKNKWYKNFSLSFSEFLNHAILNNFTIYVENTWEKDGELFINIFRDFGCENLAMCLDIGHVYCFSKNDFTYWFSEFEKHIRHIHLSDNNLKEDEHLQLGEGNIPFKSIIPLLKQKDDLTYTLETDLSDIDISLNYLKRIRSNNE